MANKKQRIIMILAIVLSMLLYIGVQFSVITAVAETETTLVPAEIVSEVLALREKPSKSAEKLEMLNHGEQVYIEADTRGNYPVTDGYVLVKTENGSEGWVLEELLLTFPHHLIVGDGNVMVYSSPSMNHKLTDALIPGSEHTLIEIYDDFWVIEFRMGAGYIPRKSSDMYLKDFAEYYSMKKSTVMQLIEDAYVRALPYDDALAIASFKVGDSVDVVNTSGLEYVIIRIGERYAYIPRKSVGM